MGYTAVPGQKGRICGVRFEEAASAVMPLVVEKKAPKTETRRIGTIIASAQVESMSHYMVVKKRSVDRRLYRWNSQRGKEKNELTKLRLGRYV